MSNPIKLVLKSMWFWLSTFIGILVTSKAKGFFPYRSEAISESSEIAYLVVFFLIFTFLINFIYTGFAFFRNYAGIKTNLKKYFFVATLNSILLWLYVCVSEPASMIEPTGTESILDKTPDGLLLSFWYLGIIWTFVIFPLVILGLERVYILFFG